MLTRSKALWRGIRRHGAGWQAEVRVKGHPRLLLTFPLDADPREMQKLRKAEKARLQAKRLGTSGTFAADAAQYLKAKKSLPPSAYKERERLIGLWVKEFGTKPRAAIRPIDIRIVVTRWLTEGPKRVMRSWRSDCIKRHGARWVDLPVPLSASQVSKRMRALENLWTVLDGRHAPNPVREVPEPKEPEGTPRGLPYDVVEAILAAMPDRGRAAKGQTRKGLPGLTRLRLRTIAYTGLSHTELKSIQQADLHLDDPHPWVWIQGRDKGQGTKGTAQPLTSEGAAALRALAAAGGLGPFSHSAMWKSFQRACRHLKLERLTPYDLRHSFASEILEKTGGNLDVTQLLMRHKSRTTTLRYGKRAIDPVRAAAIATVREAGAFLAHFAPKTTEGIGKKPDLSESAENDGTAHLQSKND